MVVAHTARDLDLLEGILLGELGGRVGFIIGVSFGGLLAEIDEASEAPVDRKLVKLGGRVLRRSRSQFVNDQLTHELDRIEVKLN
jgi:hypothetical protein